MQRSGGVTFSAILVFIGSAFALLVGLLVVLGSLMASFAAPGTSALNFRFIAMFEGALYFGFGGWGIASGIGLIKLRQWARISMFVFAGLLLLMSFWAILVTASFPMPPTTDPNVTPIFMRTMRAVVMLMFSLTAALAGFWIYFFNRKNVKAQFSGAQQAADGTAFPSIPGKANARPLSISIIGWYLLIASALSPLFLPFATAYFPGRSMPLAFLGQIFFGRVATVIILAIAGVQIVAAVGLLKLQNWGRLLTIGLQLLTLLNLVLDFGPPANRARFQQAMDTMMTSFRPQITQSARFAFPAWIGVVSATPIVLVILWFLFAERRAFVRSET